MTSTKTMILLLMFSFISISYQPVSASILTKCKAAQELGKEQVIDRTFISQFVCLMHYDGEFNTSKISEPGTQSTRMYGIFQIRSSKYCSLTGDGGLCKKNCRNFVDDKLRDDMICANIIFQTEGLKYWKNWVKKCKNKSYDISSCKFAKIAEEDIHVNDVAELDQVVQPSDTQPRKVLELTTVLN